MIKVLELFSTDRRLLEQRGSLIIRQLCLHLNAERIFRTIAEILEKDDVSSVRSYQKLPLTNESGLGVCKHDGSQIEHDLDNITGTGRFQTATENLDSRVYRLFFAGTALELTSISP